MLFLLAIPRHTDDPTRVLARAYECGKLRGAIEVVSLLKPSQETARTITDVQKLSSRLACQEIEKVVDKYRSGK